MPHDYKVVHVCGVTLNLENYQPTPSDRVVRLNLIKISILKLDPDLEDDEDIFEWEKYIYDCLVSYRLNDYRVDIPFYVGAVHDDQVQSLRLDDTLVESNDDEYNLVALRKYIVNHAYNFALAESFDLSDHRGMYDAFRSSNAGISEREIDLFVDAVHYTLLVSTPYPFTYYIPFADDSLFRSRKLYYDSLSDEAERLEYDYEVPDPADREDHERVREVFLYKLHTLNQKKYYENYDNRLNKKIKYK